MKDTRDVRHTPCGVSSPVASPGVQELLRISILRVLLCCLSVMKCLQDALYAVNKHAAAFEPALRSRGPDQFSARQASSARQVTTAI